MYFILYFHSLDEELQCIFGYGPYFFFCGWNDNTMISPINLKGFAFNSVDWVPDIEEPIKNQPYGSVGQKFGFIWFKHFLLHSFYSVEVWIMRNEIVFCSLNFFWQLLINPRWIRAVRLLFEMQKFETL